VPWPRRLPPRGADFSPQHTTTDRLLYGPPRLAALTQLEYRFDRLIARSERQRNALIHGTSPTYPVLASVDRFVRELNAFTAQVTLRAAETGETPLERLEIWRIEGHVRRQRLNRGDDPRKRYVRGRLNGRSWSRARSRTH
jgi:hypothetical protein